METILDFLKGGAIDFVLALDGKLTIRTAMLELMSPHNINIPVEG